LRIAAGAPSGSPAQADATEHVLLDLGRFDPTIDRSRTGASHRIRALAEGCRMRLPELERLADGAGDLVGVLLADRWVLRPRRRDDAGVATLRVGEGGRLRVPRGVLHVLGLQFWAVVTVPEDGGSVVIWSPSILDSFLAGGA
jgi:hypothetical protein